ncbi:NUDIX hydrolase [Microbacterium sp. M3]|uniref:NUDIX hydrolase n=1 Tax=Microbacterium arthrosphaerae TaxID=792652 RepID=A0ABU4GY09_9MICO|nr:MULTISPECIES: NUDIX hydrolase [Microbacterium]MDW4571295.1 NUDIX hydrolase [Microbacterium arthrosphaerae]MDW7605150.1 NUDIX hydrolase [Microbacterium sp. M3]
MEGELWDLVDAAGTPVGLTHLRADPAFPAGLFHVVASVCVVRGDGRVLMTRRAAAKDWGLTWEFPAGSALAGETSAEAAARELHEETGVRVEVEQLELVGRLTERIALFDVYVTHVPGDPALAPDPEEVCESAWVPFAEALRRADAGVMAGPWAPRLAQLGARLGELVDTGDSRRDPG